MSVEIFTCGPEFRKYRVPDAPYTLSVLPIPVQRTFPTHPPRPRTVPGGRVGALRDKVPPRNGNVSRSLSGCRTPVRGGVGPPARAVRRR